VPKARSEHPDLILMDIQLPVMDGNDATRRIKADPALGPSSVRRRDRVLPGIRPGPLAGVHVGCEDRHRMTRNRAIGHHLVRSAVGKFSGGIPSMMTGITRRSGWRDLNNRTSSLT
jgi:hypothetical protein